MREATQRDDIAHIHRRRELATLRDIAEALGPLPGIQRLDIQPIDGDAPAIRQQSQHRAQRRGFSSTIGADQRHHLARGDG